MKFLVMRSTDLGLPQVQEISPCAGAVWSQSDSEWQLQMGTLEELVEFTVREGGFVLIHSDYAGKVAIEIRDRPGGIA